MTIAQRIGAVATRINADTERRSWHRAIAAKVMAHRNNEDGSRIIKQAWPDDVRAFALTKGAVTPTTSTGGYPQYDPVIAYRSLAPPSAALALFQLGTVLNLEGANTIRIPSLAAMPVQPVFVEEGKPAPNVQWDFDNTVLGPVRKILMLAAVTEELENCTPETASAVIGRVLADIAHRGIDTTAFGTAAADVVQPAGLLYNVTPIAAATAGPDAMVEDLGNLAGAIGAAGIDASNVVYVAGPREAQIIKAKVGAKFNSPVLMTLGLPAKAVAAFAPEGVFSGYADAPTIETGKSAAYYFEDTTLQDISDGVTLAAPVKSLFQSGLISIRVRANCAWAVATGAAQVIEDVNW